MKKLFLTVSIRDLTRKVYDGEAYAISGVSDKGPFDILPFHANFISIVKETITIHQKDGSKEEFKIGSGVLKNHNNNVVVFMGIETLI